MASRQAVLIRSRAGPTMASWIPRWSAADAAPAAGKLYFVINGTDYILGTVKSE